MRTKLVFLFIMSVLLVQSGYGWMLYSAADPPDSGITGHSFVDILYHENTVWLASGRGLSKTDDYGETWVTYSAASGLTSDEPSAMYGRPGQFWMAGSHTEMFDLVNFPFGDGFSITFDNGLTWETSIPDDSVGASFAKLIYDMTGTDSSTYAAAFHGGLIVSHDFGLTWEHMFFSPIDSSDWHADEWVDLTTGRYYSCAADTFHTDTTILWAGTAGGIQKFYYLPKRVKLGGNTFHDIVGEDSLVYLATEGGVTRTDSNYSVWFTADTINGLGANTVGKLALFDDRLWASVIDTINNEGLGLFVSDDMAETWTKVTTTLFEGSGAGVFDYKILDDTILLVAAGDSGAVLTFDGGVSWQRFYVDSTDTDQASANNQVYSLDATMDSLFLGTKGGLNVVAYLPPFEFGYDTLITFPEHDSSGSFVSLVRRYATDSTFFTWLGLEPQTPLGTHAAYLLDTIGPQVMIYGPSMDVPVPIYDFAYNDTVTIIATGSGIFWSENNRNLPVNTFSIADALTGRTLNKYSFISTEIINNRIYGGSDSGLAYRITNDNWNIQWANTDKNKHDLAVLRTFENSGLPGDWVVAMDAQQIGSDTVIWAACRRVAVDDQINAVAFSTDFGNNWNTVLPNMQVWNFAFDQNGTAYAAASEGLYSAPSPWTDWTRNEIIDPLTKDTMVEHTEVYAVEVIEEFGTTSLWVGTSLGLAKQEIDPGGEWGITRIFKKTDAADDVFASPVPFSPVNPSGRLTIHYRVETAADITVEIYDFAMNLVAVPAENRPRAGGNDYFESWDGYNQSGDMVATGMYFFKVTYSTGDEFWGRLAIVP
ncbi:MAG: hypothetical protein GY841_19650 [FCB group bacterium]|nr:hypothetical protein [FCB group bacterium]